MNKLLLALLFTQIPVYPVFAELSATEQAIIDKCSENVDVDKKIYSPKVASECEKSLVSATNDPNGGASEPLIRKYSKMPGSSVHSAQILGNNHALLDLNNAVLKMNGLALAKDLARTLDEKEGCALCGLELGPLPEKAFDWVGKYAGGRLTGFKSGVRSWESLGELRRSSLSEYSEMDENRWNNKLILDRYCRLAEWAQAQTNALKDDISGKGFDLKVAGEHMREMLPILREDLVFVDRWKCPLSVLNATALKQLMNIEAGVAAKEADKTEKEPSATDKKARELAAAKKKLEKLSPDDAKKYGDNLFDNEPDEAEKLASIRTKPSAPTGTAPAMPGSIKPVTLPPTPAQEKKLSTLLLRMEKGKPAGYLADVMRKTDAGRETVAFLQSPKYAKAGSNKLDYGFTSDPDIKGAFGYWSTDDKHIKMNSDLAVGFAASRNITIAQLLKSPRDMKDFALLISPTSIHELEHQEQKARAREKGTDYLITPSGRTEDPYTRHSENLSNDRASRHIIQYAQDNGAESLKRFFPQHVNMAVKYQEGGIAALDTLVAPRYATTDSRSGRIAREETLARGYAAALDKLEAESKNNPSGLTASQKREMADYRQMLDTRYKWYIDVCKEAGAAEAKALNFRMKYGGKGVWAEVPPGLPDGGV